MVTLVASAGVLDGTSGAQAWTEEVTISALTASGGAAVITHSSAGFGVQGGRKTAQIDHFPSNNTSEQFVIEFNGPVQDVVLQLGLMSASEFDGNPETGAWTAFDGAGNQVASGLLNPLNGTQVANLTYDIPIDAGGQSFTKLVLTATGYNGGVSGSPSGDSSDFALNQLIYTAEGTPGGQLPSDIVLSADTFAENATFAATLSWRAGRPCRLAPRRRAWLDQSAFLSPIDAALPLRRVRRRLPPTGLSARLERQYIPAAAFRGTRARRRPLRRSAGSGGKHPTDYCSACQGIDSHTPCYLRSRHPEAPRSRLR